MIKSPKTFLIGIATGVAITLVFGLLTLRYPFLLTENSKASYAVGQKIARDHRRLHIEFDPWIAAAAIKDGQNEDSRLDPQELNNSMVVVRKNSYVNEQEREPRLRERARTENREGNKDKDGFVSRFGIRFKPKETLKDLVLENVPPEAQFQFHLVVYNSKKEEVYSTVKLKKPLSVLAQEVSMQMKLLLNSIKKGDSLEVKVHPEFFQRLKLEIPNDPKSEFIYEIQKLN